jgi:zinc D-Ala-D-Ala carboxypeptidase
VRRLLLALFALMALSACALSPPRNLYAGFTQNYGTWVANSGVDTFCLTPKLRFALWGIETFFGRKVVVSSGYRDPFHNARVGGQDDSFHMKCMAADIFIPGVDKRRLIAAAYRNDLVGGLGCYPGRDFIHVDVRDRPRGWSHPVTFSGC